MSKIPALPTGMLYQIEIDGKRFEYHLRQSKSAQNLRVRIGPNNATVVLPACREVSAVEPFLREHSAWIIAQLTRTEALRHVRRPQLVQQDEILYRGVPTLVRVEESQALRGAARITFDENGIHILRSAGSTTPPERSLENWLRKQATHMIVAELEPLTRKLNRTPNRIYIMNQRTKWGNCSVLGNLSFNWRLIHAPPYVLRYLVTHEAVHLAVPDHSKRFWLTVQSLCPETERARQWLSANGRSLLKSSSVDQTWSSLNRGL